MYLKYALKIFIKSVCSLKNMKALYFETGKGALAAHQRKCLPPHPPASSADLATGSGDRQTRESCAVSRNIWHRQTAAARRVQVTGDGSSGQRRIFLDNPPEAGFRFSKTQLVAPVPACTCH